MIPTYLLERYKLQDSKVQRELQRLKDWTNVFPLGQPPQSYEIAWKHLLSYQEKKPYQTWLKMRSYIIGDDFKTLWQHFPYVTSPSHLPTYAEIEAVILPTNGKKEMVNQV